jgi:hypothetical protein
MPIGERSKLSRNRSPSPGWRVGASSRQLTMRSRASATMNAEWIPAQTKASIPPVAVESETSTASAKLYAATVVTAITRTATDR